MVSLAPYQSAFQFAQRCVLETGSRSEIFVFAVFLLLRTGSCDYVWICRYLAADPEADAADCGLFQQTNLSDLGNGLGSTDIQGKDYMEDDFGSGDNICRHLPSGDR